jgi:hypothetical protein
LELLSSSGSVFFPTSLRNLFLSSFFVFFPWGSSSGLPVKLRAFRGWAFGLMKPASCHGKCLHCKRLFVPDCRNRGRQQYCSSPECQKASKRARQQRWLSKPENRDYFRDAKNVERVREWRREHPGYWKRCRRRTPRTLQDACSTQPTVIQKVKPAALPDTCARTLQDVCQVQVPLLVGLVSKFTDCTLQDDIVLQVRGLIAKGRDILDQPSRRFPKENIAYDAQKDPAAGPVATGAAAV